MNTKREDFRHPRLREAAQMIDSGWLAPAREILREYLDQRPRDGRALHLLSRIARGQGQLARAMELSKQAVESAPDLIAARTDYAALLILARQPEAALTQADELLKREPQQTEHRGIRARALEMLGDYAGAAAIWQTLTEQHPSRVQLWLSYASALRALGQIDACVAACRRAIALDPASGAAWWSLADLKTYRFDDADIRCMEAAIAMPAVAAEDRARLHFALGKARTDRGLHEAAFGDYARGNALRSMSASHDPDVLTNYVARAKRAFDSEYFENFAGSGCDSREPIFVVGMMRSGSTLVEQILASHSRIEATRELPEIAAISRELQQQANQSGENYFDFLKRANPDMLRRLASRYLERARAHCRLGRAHFIDKMGANFAHVGLIHLLFRKAPIVDVRRHPLASGFSIFSQYFAEGESNTLRLADIGRTWRDYAELMAHFDRAMPGRVHRVLYEDLVADPEAEIRRLLEYLELPFEQDCLRFDRTERAIATVSAEQVRLPIYRSALERWRDFEPWLGPLKAALGRVWETYPEMPESGSGASG